MTDKITLIIPIRLTGATHEGALRLSRIHANVPRDLFEILVSDYGTPAEHRAPFEALAGDGVRVVAHPSPHPLFSIGQARDFGVQMSRTPVILFNDIDFLGTEAMYRAIHAEVTRRRMGENLLDFFCVPVLFLTEQGTGQWLAAEDANKPFAGKLEIDALEADTDRIQSVAYGSSAMVVNRHHYLSLGGHDPRFTGHGAEDYDLLHRLATLAPRGPRSHDYFNDYGNNGVRHYWGFRPFFALTGLDVLPRGLHLVHLWHPRRKEKGYFRPRRNFRLLKRVMRQFDRTGAQPQPLSHLGGGAGKWLVVHGKTGDLDLVRQLLPFSTAWRPIRAGTYRQAGKRLWRHDLADIAQILIIPSLSGDAGDLLPHLPPSARVLWLLGPDANGPGDPSGKITFRGRDGHDVASAPVQSLKTPAGRPVMTIWPALSLPGMPPLATGTAPEIHPPESSLFASFGAAQLRQRDRRTRPKRRRKSPWHIRLWRWITRS